MRKYVLFFMLMVGLNVSAQTNYSNYQLEITKETLWNISVEKIEKNNFVQYIECPSKDDRRVQLVLKGNDIEKFIVTLKDVQTKYVAWIATAQKGNVKDVEKQMDVKFPMCEARYQYTKLFVDPKVTINVLFKTKGDKHYVIIQNKDQLKAKGNKWIRGEGFELIFSKEHEIDAFVNAIDYNKAKQVLQEKEDTENKFQ